MWYNNLLNLTLPNVVTNTLFWLVQTSSFSVDQGLGPTLFWLNATGLCMWRSYALSMSKFIHAFLKMMFLIWKWCFDFAKIDTKIIRLNGLYQCFHLALMMTKKRSIFSNMWDMGQRLKLLFSTTQSGSGGHSICTSVFEITNSFFSTERRFRGTQSLYNRQRYPG